MGRDCGIALLRPALHEDGREDGHHEQRANYPLRRRRKTPVVHVAFTCPSQNVRRTAGAKGLIDTMAGLSEQEFRVKSDEALESARRALLPLADSEAFEVELQNGVLNLAFEEPSEARFVVSPNAPVRQIWVSAMARSYKLSWSPDQGAFALDGETLPTLLDRLARTFLEGSG